MKKKLILLLSLAAMATAVYWLTTGNAGPEALLAALAALIGIVSQVKERPRLDSRSSQLDMPAPDENSLLVMPFANLSSDPENEYFSDGLTEELIAALAHVPSLRVISRHSAMRLKGTKRPLSELVAEFGVDFVVEGGVRKDGDAIRITAHLINARHDSGVWSQTYDGNLDDVFTFQESVSVEIADALHLRVEPARQDAHGPAGDARTPLVARSRHSSDAEAYDAYLRGVFHWNKHKFDQHQRAIQLFERAIQLDPTYALAYAGLAACYFWLGFIESMPPKKAFPKVKEFASRSLEIDPSIAEAHSYLGSALMIYEWEWDRAEAEFKRGIELDGESLFARQLYTVFLLNLGRLSEAEEQNRAALSIDPLWVKGHQDLGLILTLSGSYSEAVDQLEGALELDPGFPATHLCLGFVLVHLGRLSEAVVALAKSVEAAGGGPFFRACLAFALGFAGRLEEADAVLDELLEERTERYVPAVLIAWVHIGMGAHDAAFEWLERALDERSAMLLSAPAYSPWDPIRGDPRFSQLLDRMGLGARTQPPTRSLLVRDLPSELRSGAVGKQEGDAL